MSAKGRVHARRRAIEARSEQNQAVSTWSAAFETPRSMSGVWWRLGLLAAAGLLAYSNSLSGSFILDDVTAIVENQDIRDWSRLSSMLMPERELPVAGRPLVNVSLAINYALGGLDVRGYHVWNVAVHLGCALLVFAVVRRTLLANRVDRELRERSLDLAFAVALLWTLHPLNTEAVNYVTQRTESMMGLFYLLTFYASIRAAVTSRSGAEAHVGWRGWPFVAVLACASGMACKETMVTAPVLVALYDRVFVFDSIKAAVKERWRLYAGLAATWLVLALLLSSGPRIHSAGFTSGVSSWTYLMNQTVMIVRYLRLAVWPTSLVVNYGWPVPLTLGDVLPQALFVMTLLVGTVAALVRRPPLGFLGAAFFITLAPTSSLVPIATEVGAERRMYLPLIPIVILLVVGGVRLWTSLSDRVPGLSGLMHERASSWLLLVAVAIPLTMGTMARNREYGSSLLMAQTVVDRYPTSHGHHELAVQLINAGRHEDALAYLRLAVTGAPRAHFTLGAELFEQGRTEEAISELQVFLEKQPLLLEAISARELLGRAFAKQERWPEAVEQYRQVLRMNPSAEQLIETHLVLANALYALKSYEDAISHYRQYLQARPDHVGALSRLGIALMATGQLPNAISAFQRAAEINPQDGAVQQNLANALYDARNVDAALEPARRAVALRPDDPAAHDLLGQILALQGQLPAAAAEFERALAIDPNAADVREHLSRVTRARSR
jgi:protein O-mannosyl-transferase